MANKKVADWLVELSRNPGKRAEFFDDPDKTMEKHGFTDTDKKVIKSGDREQIMAHAGLEEETGGHHTAWILNKSEEND